MEEQVTHLAYQKAKSVFDITQGDRIVIGSDTMVTKNEKIYGKPKTEEHAKEMLQELTSGDKTHQVLTGLCILIEKNGICQEYKTFDKTTVFLKPMSDEEINKWIATEKAMDKAGAYAIQDEFSVFVEKIEGNYSTVLGLPTHKLYDLIKDEI